MKTISDDVRAAIDVMENGLFKDAFVFTCSHWRQR